MGNNPEEYAQNFRPHFEDGMGIYQTHAKESNDRLFVPLLKDMGRFFARFRIDRYENNQHSKFISRYAKRLREGRIILATLNYDCLLDIALNKSVCRVAYPGLSGDVRILKVHGGCNLLLKTNGLVVKGDFVVTDGVFNAAVEVVPPEQVATELDKRLAPPAMSLYARGKKVLFSPWIVDAMLKEFQESMNDAGLVVIVGVRPNPSDDHIWEHLARMKGRLASVGNRQYYTEWTQANRNEMDNAWLGDRFISSFDAICREIDEVL